MAPFWLEVQVNFIYSLLLLLLTLAPSLPSIAQENCQPAAKDTAVASEHSPAAAEGKPMSSDLCRTIDYVLNCYGNSQESTHKLVPVSKIIETDCKIEKLGMLFDYHGSLGISAARKLVVQAVSDLLQTVNSSSKLKPYLKNGGLVVDDVIIRIRVRPDACGFYYPPLGNVALVSAMEDKIVYDTMNSYSYMLNNLLTETYQQGLKLSAAH